MCALPLPAAGALCPPPLKGLGWGRKRGGDPSSIARPSGPREGIGEEGEGHAVFFHSSTPGSPE